VKNFTVKFPTVAEKKQIIWGITFCRTVYLFQITKFHETEKCTDTTKTILITLFFQEIFDRSRPIPTVYWLTIAVLHGTCLKVTWWHSLPRPLCSRLRPDVRDRRQTDR